MKKKITAVLMAACTLICMTGCQKNVEETADAFALPHYNGVATDGATDSKYFYRNDFSLSGGDDQIIWVSEEQDPEYGGYYYMYNSDCEGVYMMTFGGEDPHKSSISCFRSKDLSHWERVGAVDNGFSVRFEMDDWVVGSCWAPETVYDPVSEKYYMYFSAAADPNPIGDVEYETNEDSEDDLQDMFNRYFVAVCSSDTPVGPFKLVTSESYYGDATAKNLNGRVLTAHNPTINIRYDCELDYVFGIIDLHPYFDGEDLYLYFVHHTSSGQTTNDIWGMKMKDMVSPDYSTARMLLKPNYRKVEYIEDSGYSNLDERSYRLIDEFIDAEEYNKLADKTNKVSQNDYGYENHVNEGPFMLKDGDRYYLTYSPKGVGLPNYQVRQSIGTSPLGSFEKPTLDPATIMGADDSNAEILGTGHHCFIDGGSGDMYCVSWPNKTPRTDNINETGRAYALDRIHFTVDDTYGRIICGGPTTSLQYKPSRYTGRVNVAPKATVTATNAVAGTEKYINDEMVVFRSYYREKEFAADGNTTITLTFDAPTTVSAIMIYNSYDYYYAFDSIDSVAFHLAEKPSWYTAEQYSPIAVIKDLPFNRDYFDGELHLMSQGGSALASFNDIKVNKIEITVSKKISDLRNNQIRISDIVVLGKGE